MLIKDLRLHCYAEKAETQWNACCLDLTLAAQADNFGEAKIKLESMIKDYLFDVLEGEDKAYTDQLLFRPAPLSEWIKYYLIKVIKSRLFNNSDNYKSFPEIIPLKLTNP